MAPSWHAFFTNRAAALVGVLIASGSCVLVAGALDHRMPSFVRKRIDRPQLISIEPLPQVEGDMCKWLPLTAVSMEQVRATLKSSTDEPKSAIDVDRAPIRVIRDTYPTYSALAVDVRRNEVFLQDENLFVLNVFNRLDNTPPGANFTEPKRMLGGIQTKLEFNCGLYVDPDNGDVYSIANDTVDTMVVFPRDAQGNVKPMRELRTPHGTYGIAVNEAAQELFLTVEHDNAVVVYPKIASGNAKPTRKIGGDQTGLADPHGIALDPKNNRMFVSNHGSVSFRGEGVGAAAENRAEGMQPPPGGERAYMRGSGKFQPPSITAYPLNAVGNIAPLGTIQGPATQLNWPAAMYMDAEHAELYVANDMGDSVLVFRDSDAGDVAPSRLIKGSKTGIKNPTGVFVDTKNDEVWVSNMGNHTATVYSRTANGNVSPLRTIRSAPAGKLALAIGNPGAVAYDPKREEILVPN